MVIAYSPLLQTRTRILWSVHSLQLQRSIPMEPTVGDSVNIKYNHDKIHYKSLDLRNNVPNPRDGLSPPAVGELSSTSNSFRHSKRSSKLWVSGTAIVQEERGRGNVNWLHKVRRSKVILVVWRCFQECRGDSEKRISTQRPALKGGHLTQRRESTCVTGTWSWSNQARRFRTTKCNATFPWSKCSC